MYNLTLRSAPDTQISSGGLPSASEILQSDILVKKNQAETMKGYI